MSSLTQTDLYGSLSGITSIIQQNKMTEAGAEIKELFDFCSEGMDTDSQKFLGTLITQALYKRIKCESLGENLYLNRYETSQIQLFDILIEKFPFVHHSQKIINQAIADKISQNAVVTLMDIGIGQGTQVINILKLCQDIKQLKKIHIVGIEPFGDALQMAEKNILAMGETLPFDVEFTAVHGFAESLDFGAIPGLEGTIIVNASLALHHIQTSAERNDTLARIRALKPALFVLTEPNSDHFEPDLTRRLQQCYHHFYTLFQVIDKLDIDETSKNALKLFFGREIEDILAKEEKERYEKHEPATKWIERLRSNQFQINSNILTAPSEKPYGVEISYHAGGYLGFRYGAETVLAVICAQSN